MKKKKKIFGNLSQAFLPIISLIFCGHLGDYELDGVSLANSVIKPSTNLNSLIFHDCFFNSKLIGIIVLTAVYGLATATDTLFPQVFYT
jgi:hypothetical protein